MYVLRWLARVWFGLLVATTLLIGLLLVLRLVLPMPLLSPPPTLVQASPSDGSTNVPPRARLSLSFNTPMNRRSVERAIRIDPPLEAVTLWDDDNRTVTISPTQSLRPDTEYRISLQQGALSRLFRAPDAPLMSLFRTAPAPAVLATLPADGAQAASSDAPISIRFSRAVVPSDTLGLPTQLPELELDPPVAGSARWLDPTTVIFQPAVPLLPGARYRATLRASLTDLSGGELGRDVTWNFETPPPTILAVAPPIGGRWIAPRAPLSIRLSQPIDTTTIAAGFGITPTMSGDFAATTLPDATQAITFTPAADWQPGVSYSASLRLGPAASARWSFTSAPRPAVIGRFPGEGQLLPLGQDIRLVFNTPVDAATLRGAIQLDPPADVLDVFAEGAEARIDANLAAATAYTLTLPTSLTDSNGVLFSRAYQIRFVTAPANPALQLTTAALHIVQVAPGTPGLPIRRTNLSSLNLELYALDQATTVRALAFGEADWPTFQPERYQQPLLRTWSVALSGTLNTAIEEQLPLALADGQPLPTGTYYLRVIAQEGPRADLLLVVSRTRLAMQTSPAGLIVWATDVISATPIGTLPVVLYQDGALIERGVTDTNGLWQSRRTPATASTRINVLSEGATPALASNAWNDRLGVASTAGFRAWLTTDRAAYRPGERVALAGFVRRIDDQTVALPPRDLQIALSVRQLGAPEPLYRTTVTPSSTGAISAGFSLPPTAPIGEYVLGALLSGAVFHTDFVVRAEQAPPGSSLGAPVVVAAGEPAPVDLAFSAADGSPIASAAISWTLSAERQPFPARSDYIFGDAEQAATLPESRSGAGLTDAMGRFGLVITDTLADATPMRYRLLARASEPGGLETTDEATFTVIPAQVYGGVRLPRQVLNAGERGQIDVLTLTPAGQPAAQIDVEATIDRRTWQPAEGTEPQGPNPQVLQPSDRRITTLRGRTGDDGTLALPLLLNAGGEYRVSVVVADAAGRQTSSATTMWVAEPGFTDWLARSKADERLIADREVYHPGDTATLLLATPHADGVALLTRARAGALQPEVRPLRAGEPLTLTLTAEDAPEVRVAVLASSANPLGATTPITLATTTLLVVADDTQLDVAIAFDQATFAPGATATLAISTTDMNGAAVPAELVVGVIGARAAPRYNTFGPGRGLAETFANPAPSIATAQVPGAAPPAPLAPAPLAPAPAAELPPPAQPGPLVYWNSALRTDAAGVLTVTVPLPDDPADLQVLVWAASGADRFGVASTSLAITRPLELDIAAPEFFRAGDRVEVLAVVRNTSAITQSARLTLSADGVEVRDSAAQSIEIAAGGSARVSWPAQVGTAPRATLRVALQATGATAISRTLDRPIVAVNEMSPSASEIGVLREYLDPQTNRPLNPGNLRSGQLVRVRLTLINYTARRAIALDEPLPGGTALVKADDAVFADVRRETAELRVTAAELAPGIYRYSYLLRASATGQYEAPPPTIQSGGRVLGVGTPTQLRIIAQP